MLNLRGLSVIGRSLDACKDQRRVLKSFSRWRAQVAALPAPRTVERRLLIIRLDDIGDYLLFRNCLGQYRKSPRWQGHRITLLGNVAWRDLWTLLDADTVDEVIWVHKNDYLYQEAYRATVWQQLRAAGFSTVIAPSRTRPLLLDDVCMLAAAAPVSLGSVNTYRHSKWNRLSDRLYPELFAAGSAASHEFSFNVRFTEWACAMPCPATGPEIAPEIAGAFSAPRAGPYVICFIGASTRSRRWPVGRWIEFIRRFQAAHTGDVVLAGSSRSEVSLGAQIQSATQADSIVGQVSLPELVRWVAGAQAVLTNDTMAAHLSAACKRPTVVIANGGNHMRFTEYGIAGHDHVVTVYPETFKRWRRRVGDSVPHYLAVSADIASIRGEEVFDALRGLLQRSAAAPCTSS